MASNDIISSLGAGSGIDIAKLVTQLTAVERAPQQERLDARKEKLEAQISGYGQLKSALDSVQTAMAALGDNDLFNARSVSVPSSDVITANKVAPGAQTGTYKIEVTQVASAQSLAMASQSDRAAALGKSGDLNIRFGEWENASTFNVNNDRASLKISVAATDSLDSIAEKINSQNAGVQASVLKVDGQFQLMLTSPSGKSNAMEITGSTASLSDFNFNSTNRTATQTQAAQDAELTLNGLKVTRESNDIDDVIPGLSFTINKASPSESLSFSITADKSTAEQSIRDFVTAYNTFQKSAQELVGYSRDKDNKLVRGALAGDSAARTMISRLRETIGGSVPGVQSGFTALTNVGIRTERDGSLSIDEKEFSAAISGNFNQLESLFATRSSSTNTAVSVNPGTFANRAVSGTHDVVITRDPTKGQAVGNAITHPLATGTSLVASGESGGYSFKLNVGGTQSDTIELTGSYGSSAALVAALQTQIDADTSLAGKGVTVGFDAGTGRFSFASQTSPTDPVTFSAIGNQMGALGFTPTAASLTANDMTLALDPDTGDFVTPLDTSAPGDYSFKINVNGVGSDLIQLTGTYANPQALRNDLQSLLDSDAALTADGAGVDVSFNDQTGKFSFVSRQSGEASEVSFTQASPQMAELGIDNSLTAAGTGLTAMTHSFSTPTLVTSGPGLDYSFKMSVDGIKSGSITLTGSYASVEELRADLQSQINGDATLKKAGAAVDVNINTDPDTGVQSFSFVSREYGSISKVSVTEASADMAALGIASSGLTSTDGVDVKGTINGQEGFGAGNVLLPALDSAAYGLNLSVSEGATAQGAFQISFSRGIAGELSKLIDDFQGAAGVFKTREDGIQKQLDGIKEEVSLLDTRMEGISARLTAQFTAMERIVSSLKDTGSQLDGLNDRLPFTASS
ncbi:flagellar filament capping protein FliD [Thiobaca trueperi]|uniref:Filament cap protein n=1 Tax=Thiobaca trueperi TaxID=127458 RepID=A0A4R3MTL1_9GAMM|nr:flagellar filament capping protein FliD [Thiobaca trueperi]TCT19780.1 flagellar hook-associated protein 2 [Thiobaca trueperi]